MPVYVDPLFDTVGWSTAWPYPEACHLMADTVEELHPFAARVGMRRAWFQEGPPVHSVAHYDLTRARRAVAVKLGAIEVCDCFRPNRRHLHWAATGLCVMQLRKPPEGGRFIVKIPTHWPGGQPMTVEHRMHFMAFRCGVVLCEGCGTLIAKCGCGKEDDLHMLPSCPSCDPVAHPPTSY